MEEQICYDGVQFSPELKFISIGADTNIISYILIAICKGIYMAHSFGNDFHFGFNRHSTRSVEKLKSSVNVKWLVVSRILNTQLAASSKTQSHTKRIYFRWVTRSNSLRNVLTNPLFNKLILVGVNLMINRIVFESEGSQCLKGLTPNMS